jgi:hypothetical protein
VFRKFPSSRADAHRAWDATWGKEWGASGFIIAKKHLARGSEPVQTVHLTLFIR